MFYPFVNVIEFDYNWRIISDINVFGKYFFMLGCQCHPISVIFLFAFQHQHTSFGFRNRTFSSDTETQFPLFRTF